MSVRAGAPGVDRKGYRRGTHRLVPPEETWSRIRPLLRSYGITRVADVTGLDDVGVPVHQAIRPASATLSVSQGKGVTHELARVSAVMEMIEFAHAERLRPSTVRCAAAELELGGYDVRDLQLAPGSLVSDSVVLDWLEARTLVSGSVTLVPREYVHLTDTVERRWAVPLFQISTNGLASGNSLEEAVLHGLYELVERDCLADVDAVERRRRTRVDLATVDDADCLWIMERLGAAGNWFEVVDAMNRFGLPCYVAHIWSPSFPMLTSGSGCHLDPRVALNRALTEAAQARLTVISGTRDSIPEQVYLLQNVRTERPADPADAPVADFADRPDLSTEAMGTDLAEVASRIAGVTGREPFAVDLSDPGSAFAVAKTVAPGLRFEPGHGDVQRVRPA